MNKLLLSFLFFLVTFSMNSQNIDKIDSLEKAENFIKSNPNIKCEIKYLETTTDSLELYKKYFSEEDFKKNNQVVETQFSTSMRVNYIYLDGQKLSKKEIDNKRKVIIDRLKKRASFSALSKEFTMDGSDKNEGDLAWFDEGVMHLTFENEIKKHKKGDVFIVDIPENNWYYVVEKSFEDAKKVKFFILTIQN